MRQGSGCCGFRAGVRGISGLSRLLRSAVWPQGVPGPQPSLSPGSAGAVRGAAQRRQSVGDGSGVSQGDAAVSLGEPPDALLDDLRGAITAIAPISGVIAAERKVPNGVRDAPRSCNSLSRSNFPCILAVFPGYAPSRFSRPLRSSPIISKTGPDRSGSCATMSLTWPPIRATISSTASGPSPGPPPSSPSSSFSGSRARARFSCAISCNYLRVIGSSVSSPASSSNSSSVRLLCAERKPLSSL